MGTSATAPPFSRNVADYRPGGTAAVAAGTGYRQVACSGSSWPYNPAQVVGATVVYVPCSVTFNAVGVTAPVLLVTEGTVAVSGGNTTVGDATRPWSTGILSASTASPAVNITASGFKALGNVQAMSGGVTVSGSNTQFRCGILAGTITLGATSPVVTVDSACA
jgi:hypothetical protein